MTIFNSLDKEALDWNEEEREEAQIYVDNEVTDNEELIAQDDNQKAVIVQPCSSMLTMETIRPEKKKFYSLQVFNFGTMSNSSSSSSLADSVPLLDDSDTM